MTDDQLSTRNLAARSDSDDADSSLETEQPAAWGAETRITRDRTPAGGRAFCRVGCDAESDYVRSLRLASSRGARSPSLN